MTCFCFFCACEIFLQKKSKEFKTALITSFTSLLPAESILSFRGLYETVAVIYSFKATAFIATTSFSHQLFYGLYGTDDFKSSYILRTATSFEVLSEAFDVFNSFMTEAVMKELRMVYSFHQSNSSHSSF